VGDQVVVPKKAKPPVVKKDKQEKEIKVIEDSPEVLHYRAMAKALVPKRNEQEQQEVNRLYLNWISEGTYG